METPIRHEGNQDLFLALEMSLMCTAAGIPLHVHAEGLRGTGKTTIMRWAHILAPGITRIKNCRYYCRPDSPHCPEHLGNNAPIEIEQETVPMPFIEIGHGAKLSTILGSVDLARITDANSPQATILPGAIPMANRGILLIDEINRLAETAPEITDVLLSVMGTKPGKIKIEETGLEPWEIQTNTSVWATSNPDENPGPLEEVRRQLSDRFDLVVRVQRPSDPIVIQKLLWNKHRSLSSTSLAPEPGSKMAYKTLDVNKVGVPQTIIRYMADLYVERNIESLRAIESLDLGSRCLAALREKKEVSFHEIIQVLPLVLRHRVEPMVLSDILKDLRLRKAAGAVPRTSLREHNEGLYKPKPIFASDTPNNHGRVIEANDENAFPGRNKTKHNPGTPRPEHHRLQPPTESIKQPGWFRRLFMGYPKHTEPNPRQVINQPSSRKAAEIQNPSKAGPVSPPDEARPITSLAWKEILKNPDWKTLTK